MSFNDDRIYEIDKTMDELRNVRRALRQREKNISARMQYLNGLQGLGSDGSQQIGVNSIADLKQNLEYSLPSYMMPGNIGGINEVCWPFYFQMDFDFGNPYTLNSAFVQTQYFQVTQESAFILMSISRSHTTVNTQDAPLSVEFIDVQSARRFNDGPVPIQAIGFNSQPTILPTPMLLLPNARWQCTLRALPEVNQVQNLGSSAMQMTFFGYRIRIEDADKVLSTIFG